jgi:hypothetical protein
MRWDAFERACPEIATLARERFTKDEVVLVGTIRADGSPRISPNECDFTAGRLFVSMMWRSKKAVDLLRDPRVVVHSTPSDRMNPGGDIKLYGRVVDEQDPGVRAAFRDAIRARIDWAPDEPGYHCFSVDVEAAGYTVFGEDSHALAWDPDHELRRLELH